MKEIKLGRVVGSRIRHGSVLPFRFDGWLNGDIFIHDEGNMIPYYEYIDGELHFLGYLQGQSGFTAKVDSGYFSLYVANNDGYFEDEKTGEKIEVKRGDIIVATDNNSISFELDEEGNLYYEIDNIKFTEEEK